MGKCTLETRPYQAPNTPEERDLHEDIQIKDVSGSPCKNEQEVTISEPSFRIPEVDAEVEPEVVREVGPDDAGLSNLIEIRGIRPGTKRQMVQHFFENASVSGGGVIKNLHYNEFDGRALIEFANDICELNILIIAI